MSDLSERIRLLKEIAEASARFQAIVRPWWASCEALIDAGVNVDVPKSAPPEMSALSNLIRQLQYELVMIDPTADVPVTVEMREVLLDRQQRRLQIEAHDRALGEQISAVPTPDRAEAKLAAKAKKRRFFPRSMAILDLLRDLGMIRPDGSVALDTASLERFCVAADKKHIPTPARDGWNKTWRRTIDNLDSGKGKIQSYLNSLAKRVGNGQQQ